MDKFIEQLKEMCLETEYIGKEICSNLKGDMTNDLLYMCKSFSNRQVSQIRSLNVLADQDDAILIGRSMFEGALYLCHSLKHKDMPRRWRLFCVIIDKQRMNDAEDNGENVPDEVKKNIGALLPEVDNLFKNNKGKYVRNWYGNSNIKDLAKGVGSDFDCLYEKYYAPMSEYHHWSPASFGKRYKNEGDLIVKIDSDEVNLERANAICMGLSSIFSTLKVSCDLFKINDVDKIKKLELKLRCLSGLSIKEITINA